MSCRGRAASRLMVINMAVEDSEPNTNPQHAPTNSPTQDIRTTQSLSPQTPQKHPPHTHAPTHASHSRSPSMPW